MHTPIRSAIRTSALVLALATAAVAAPASAWPGEGGPGPMAGRMIQHLDLTAEQQASVAEIMARSREAGAADHERMREIKTQLRAQSDSFDAGATQALADELGQITARSTYRMTETRAAVNALLNEEQREKLEALEAKRGERKHGKGPGKGGHKERKATETSES
ncbi:MAG: Spy/CpxP family protein refolding chaperone [Haliea sp.]|uniref:Spy/CpxP family protein refolding chaperone n=1 Tax=Haliea sp. TaxID=1932666 RepID=UPI0032EAB059